MFGFNGQEKTNEVYGEGNAYDFGARIYDPRICRWMSVDPVSKPYESPYIGMGNNPIFYVDYSGGDNIIYIVMLPGAEAELSKQEIDDIISRANEYYRCNGLKTEVKLFSGKEFNMSYMDPTDAVVVMGSQTEIVDWVDGQSKNYEGAADFAKQVAGVLGDHVEETEGDGKIIAFNTENLRGEAQNSNSRNPPDLGTYGGFLILHGSGHLAGFSHEGKQGNPFFVQMGSFMTSGQWSYDFLNSEANKGNTFTIQNFAEGMIVPPLGPSMSKGTAAKQLARKLINTNDALIPTMKERFGNNQPVDNYENNKNNKGAGN